MLNKYWMSYSERGFKYYKTSFKGKDGRLMRLFVDPSWKDLKIIMPTNEIFCLATYQEEGLILCKSPVKLKDVLTSKDVKDILLDFTAIVEDNEDMEDTIARESVRIERLKKEQSRIVSEIHKSKKKIKSLKRKRRDTNDR